MARNKPKFLESKLFFFMLLLMSAILLVSPIFFEIKLASIQSLGIIGVALFNFISAATILFPTPGFIATGIGGSLYNPLLVALASSVGSSLGEGIGFIFGYSTKKITHPTTNKYIDILEKVIHHKYGSVAIVILAFVPNPFFDVVGIVAGLALFPLKRFLLLVFIGRFARDLIVAHIGSTI